MKNEDHDRSQTTHERRAQLEEEIAAAREEVKIAEDDLDLAHMKRQAKPLSPSGHDPDYPAADAEMMRRFREGCAHPNPWKRPFIVTGVDAWGKEVREILPPPPPSYYFWLGAEAYPDLPTVTRIVMKSR